MTVTAIILSKIIPFVLALVGFGLLILVHEMGHFFFCKLFNIHTPTFSIGFGPELLSKKIGDTHFRLALIPLGGYVEIAGQAEVGQGEQKHANIRGERSFEDKALWQKFMVMLGGILFNFLFAYVVFCLLFMVGPNQKPAIFVGGVVAGSAAEKYGLKAGDSITGINGHSLITKDGKRLAYNAIEILLENIKQNPNKQISLSVDRDNNSLTLPVTLDAHLENGITTGMLGAAKLQTTITRLPFFQAIKEGVKLTTYWIKTIVISLKKLFSQKSLEGAGGPVRIISMSFGFAQQGIMQLLTFLALISINLALINIIPLGALDGGQLLFLLIEGVTRRKIPLIVRNGINIASWLFFIGLAIFLTYQDIVALFGESIMKLFKSITSLFMA